MPTLTTSLNATLSHNRISEYTDDATDVTYRDVEPLLTPGVLVNYSVDWHVARELLASFGGRYVGRSFLANSGDEAFMTPAAHLVDAGLAWQRGPHELALRVMNVASTRFYAAGYTDGVSPYYFIAAPRAVFVTATIGF